MRQILIPTFAVATTIIFFAALLGAASTSSNTRDGEAVFNQEQCVLCHSVSSAGVVAKTKSEKLKGPDLTGVGERYEAEWIGKYVKKEADKNGKSHTKPFKGSDEELQALVDWLLEQKAEG